MVAQPETLTIPNDFLFEWDDAEEATRFWMLDMMHWPHGLSPLSATMDMPAFMRGFTKAARELCMPFTKMEAKVIHSWVYMNVEPYSTDPVQMERRMADMQGQMGKHIPGLLERWRTVYEPEVRSINEETLKGDYSKLGDRELSALLQAIVDKREREGELHMLAVFPAMGAVMFYEEVYTQLFGEPKAGEHLQLLQGFQNKSVEAGVGLWQLAREARKRPEVLVTLRLVAPGEADEALSQTEEGKAFRGAVREFLATYGWRANEMDLAEPTWFERPAPAYTLIREYAAREDYDPEGEFRSLVNAREARAQALFNQLAGGPIDMFQQVLGGAQQYLPIQEDHNFYIDQVGLSVQRVPTLEAGRRLAAGGRIANAEDVFFLHYDELQDALRGGKGDLTELVERRRRERAEGQAQTAPPALGTPPPPELGDDPMLSKFFGAPPEKHPDPRIINGNAASAGKITGTARVILSLDDAARLGRGDILVCPATMPPWTPLFAIASGVVTDHGGILSHTAIVAREYQIPAVVGTKLATSLIRDGQRITVDGSEGTVTMEN
ncbi:MAG TPA: PEP-utilizing enzyme [Dehalococcoidia bacterium]|jgi:pyruvate,water dikinase|nr:PEP-utilizing enzyme [Dehalococcoidia bacterium]